VREAGVNRETYAASAESCVRVRKLNARAANRRKYHFAQGITNRPVVSIDDFHKSSVLGCRIEDSSGY
jgi:hypothetical protein